MYFNNCKVFFYKNKHLDTSQQCDDFCVKLDKGACFSSLFCGPNINTVRSFVCLFKKCTFFGFLLFLEVFFKQFKITVIELNPELFCPSSNN